MNGSTRANRNLANPTSPSLPIAPVRAPALLIGTRPSCNPKATCPSRADASYWTTARGSNRGKARLGTLSGCESDPGTGIYTGIDPCIPTLFVLISCCIVILSSLSLLARFGFFVLFTLLDLYLSNMPSEKTITKCSETRRSTKPIMEKRRRARINNSLSELKNLILDALKKDNARHSKLEKADILEMTVKHLQNLQMQQQMAPEPSQMAKFRSGFAECANEVTRFMSRVEGVDHAVRQRLLNHLANCLTGMNNPTPLPPVHVQTSETETSANPRLLQGLQLVPTRLPSGEIAFLLPANLNVYAPNTVPISPASSTSSVTSPMSTTSSSASPSPVNVLGSSGILSPASSDRCSPSPVIMHTNSQASHCPVIMSPGSYHQRMESSSPVNYHQRMESVSPVSYHQSSVSPINYHHKMESKNVWRPF
ncbi:hypothetical protein JTE90_021028 [Oedothorax gibbosus]|uniref:Hairy n=1 Tax=Oedothorax gibbosus TaxID=931172 RepID=A0AAV6U613_9ARAC|nr:hypothetical protein JTE90_021028 [Oedothorax gibbosus]